MIDTLTIESERGNAQKTAAAATPCKSGSIFDQADDFTDETALSSTESSCTASTEEEDQPCITTRQEESTEFVDEVLLEQDASDARDWFKRLSRKFERSLESYPLKQARFCPSKENDYFESDCLTEEECLERWYSKRDIRRFRRCYEQTVRSVPSSFREGFVKAHQQAISCNEHELSDEDLLREVEALASVYYHEDDSGSVSPLLALVGLERSVVGVNRLEDAAAREDRTRVILDTARDCHFQESFVFQSERRSFEYILAETCRQRSVSSLHWARTLAMARATLQ